MSETPRLFQDLALLMQHRVDYLDYLGVDSINYFHIDTRNNTVTVLGTESAWVEHILKHDICNEVAPRLREFATLWKQDDDVYQTYVKFMSDNLPKNWMKTDYCMQDETGFHLLEIGHHQDLGIEDIGAIEDEIGAFFDEADRLRQKHPQISKPLTCIPAIADFQQLFAEQDQQLQDSCKFELDMSLFEPLPEPTLNEQEHEALKWKVMWHQDDEIAEQMSLSILEVKAIFQGIKEKYHQPRIPQYVYMNKLQEVLAERKN